MAVVSTTHEANLNFGKDHKVQHVYEHAWNCCNCKMQAGPIHNQHCCECYHQHCKYCEGNWFTILASESRSKRWVKEISYCPRPKSTPGKLQSPKSYNLELDQTKSIDKSPQKPAPAEDCISTFTTEFSQATPESSCLSTAFSQTSPQSSSLLTEPPSQISPRSIDYVNTEVGPTHEREPVQRTTIFDDALEVIESAIISLLGDHLPLVARLLPRLFHSAVRENAKTDTHTPGFPKREEATSRFKDALSLKQTQQLGIASYGTSSESRSSKFSGDNSDKTIQESNATSKGQRRTQLSQKRGRSPDHPDKPDASPTSKKSRQMQPHSSINFACHFHKRYPTHYQKIREYSECVKARIPSDRLSRITDHYRSRHKFDAGQWDTMQNIIKGRGKHMVEKWFDIWDILFPGVSRPASPYNEPEITSARVLLPNADTFGRELAKRLAAHEDFALLELHPGLAQIFKQVARQAYEEMITMESESSRVLQVSNSVRGDGLELGSQSLVGVDPRTTMAQLSVRLPTLQQHDHQGGLRDDVPTSAVPARRLRTRSDTVRKPAVKVQTGMDSFDIPRSAHSWMPYHNHFVPTGASSQNTYTQELYDEVPQIHDSNFVEDWASLSRHTELASQSSMDPYSRTTATNPLNDLSFSDFPQSFTSPLSFEQQGGFTPNTLPSDDLSPFTPLPSRFCAMDTFGNAIPYLPVVNDIPNFTSLPPPMPPFNYNNCSLLDLTPNAMPSFSNESSFSNPFFGYQSASATASVPFAPCYPAPPLPHNENPVPSVEIVAATSQHTDYRYTAGIDAGSNLSRLLEGEMRPDMEQEVMKKGKRNMGLHGGGFEGEV